MPNLINIGIYKVDQVSTESMITQGQSVLQNRASVKQNLGSIGVGDGIVWAPIGYLLNQDSDAIDNISMDAPDFNTSPQF